MEDKLIKILLVEDNPGDALLLKETLQDVNPSKFDLVCAKQLSEAVTKLGKSRFDVILLDLSLPDSFGLETVERASTMAPSVPIIVLTGINDENIGIQSVQKGAQDYLIKGQAGKDLIVRAINYSIERKKAENELRNFCDDLEIRDKERSFTLSKSIDILRTEVLRRIKAEEKIHADQKQLRSLTAELVLVEEQERRKIAEEIHDSIGPLLSFSRTELGMLEKSVSPEVAEDLKKIGLNIGQAIKQVRELIFDLSPPSLYTFGLESAIEDLAENFCREHKIKTFFDDSDEPKPITASVKILLYRFVRELLVNIAKHAQAKTVRISLSKDNGNIKIIIEDDGKGFDTSRLDSPDKLSKGFGLFSIRQRLEHIGGTIDIKSKIGRGTKITIQAPLDIKKKI